MLSANDIMKAKEIYLSNSDELLIPLKNKNAGYRFTKQNLSWEVTKINYSWKVYCKSLSGKEALDVIDKWTNSKEKENQQLNTAIEFATKKHSGQLRKATTIPYILHPLEVLQILYSMRADTNLLIAGVLHDTVEDTSATPEEIREIFGDDVAMLVASNTEDKSKSWNERKQHTIDELQNADERVKMLIMADKLSNLRSIAFDYDRIGDDLWKRFNAPKKKQGWYYDKILDSLYDLQFIPECEKAYWEITGLFKDVFAKYYSDGENKIIYQIFNDKAVYCLKKGSPEWIFAGSTDKSFYEKIKNCVLISRKDAELTEDMWNKPFWDCHKQDLKDCIYPLLSTEKRYISIEISNSRLKFLCNDFGKECECINGEDSYEFSYYLDEESTRHFFVRLRIKCGTENSLEYILKQEFGKDNGTEIFKDFCMESGISTRFYSR